MILWEEFEVQLEQLGVEGTIPQSQMRNDLQEPLAQLSLMLEDNQRSVLLQFLGAGRTLP